MTFTFLEEKNNKKSSLDYFAQLFEVGHKQFQATEKKYLRLQYHRTADNTGAEFDVLSMMKMSTKYKYIPQSLH